MPNAALRYRGGGEGEEEAACHWWGGRLPPVAPGITSLQISVLFFFWFKKSFTVYLSETKEAGCVVKSAGVGAHAGALPVATVVRRGGGEAPVAAALSAPPPGPNQRCE